MLSEISMAAIHLPFPCATPLCFVIFRPYPTSSKTRFFKSFTKISASVDHPYKYRSKINPPSSPVRMILFGELGFFRRSRAASPRSIPACKDSNKNPQPRRMKHVHNKKFSRSEAESGHWQPLLTAISEDRASIFSTQSRERTHEKRPSNKDRSKPTRFTHDRNNKCREDLIPVAMPAFSPTPFTF